MTTAHPSPWGSGWRPPEPHELPDLRARLVEFAGSTINLMGLATSINTGKTSMLPTVPSTTARSSTALQDGDQHSPGAVAAPILARLEQRRLTEATLFYANADMTSLAVAAAGHPPRERFTARRLPAETGFMLFEEPIGGYTIDVAHAVADWGAARPGLSITTPIVAVSWSPWTPHNLVMDGGPQVRWFSSQPAGLVPIPRDFTGVWITFYAAPFAKWRDIDPAEVIAEAPNGTVMTAGQIARMETSGLTTQLNWDNESVIGWGADLSAPPDADSTTEWVHVLYTAWQLMTQTGGTAPLTDTEQVPRQRAGRRRDARAGLGDGTVRVVRVHTTHRPPKEAADEDAAQSTGRRAPSWTCRWPVRPHRRYVCLNPRKHAQGDCEHEDRVIPFHVKGPHDKPLRVRNTVHLWDSQPDEHG